MSDPAKTFPLDFTEEEANLLLQLLDIAVKSKGLEVVRAVTHLEIKIRQGAKALIPTITLDELKSKQSEAQGK